MKRILFLTYYFPPEVGAASHLFYELAEALTKKKYQVTVLTGFPSYNLKERPAEYRGKLFLTEQMAGIEVLRIGGSHIPASRKIAVLRGLEHFWLALVFFLRGLFIKEMDIIILYSPPLTLGITGWFSGKIKKVPFIANVQDIFPQNAIDLGVLNNKWLIRIFRAIERFVYNNAAVVTVHSRGNKEYVVNAGGMLHKIIIIPNWVDTDFIKPAKKENAFYRKYGLENKFIISFAGVMGYSQGLEIVVHAARLLEKEEKILFIMVGEGPEKEKIKAAAAQLSNVKFIPMQPRNVYPQVLAASDIALVILKEMVKTPTVPSKILSIMAAGRPLVASAPLLGDAPKLIHAANGGICVEPENAQALANAILKLYHNDELRKKMASDGRAYVKDNLSLTIAAERYDVLIEKLLKNNDDNNIAGINV